MDLVVTLVAALVWVVFAAYLGFLAGGKVYNEVKKHQDSTYPERDEVTRKGAAVVNGLIAGAIVFFLFFIVLFSATLLVLDNFF
jgi:hypothetical protein